MFIVLLVCRGIELSLFSDFWLFYNLIFCVHIYLLFQLLCVDSNLVVDELISPKDIDPVHRYVPRQDQRNVSMRYSNQVSWLVEFAAPITSAGKVIRINTFSRATFTVRKSWHLQVLYFTPELVRKSKRDLVEVNERVAVKINLLSWSRECWGSPRMWLSRKIHLQASCYFLLYMCKSICILPLDFHCQHLHLGGFWRD